MPKSIFTGAHAYLVEILVEARRGSGLTQAELGARLGKDQSFISLVEGSQRRIDVVEFCRIAKAVGADPGELFRQFVQQAGADFD